jgi:hypothetical protein
MKISDILIIFMLVASALLAGRMFAFNEVRETMLSCKYGSYCKLPPAVGVGIDVLGKVRDERRNK